MPTLKQNLLAEFLGSIPGGRGDCIDDTTVQPERFDHRASSLHQRLGCSLRTFCVDRDFRVHIGCAFQPRRHLGVVGLEGYRQAEGRVLYRGTVRGRIHRYACCSPHVLRDDVDLLLGYEHTDHGLLECQGPCALLRGIHWHIPAGRGDSERARRLEAYRPQCGTGRRRYACDHISTMFANPMVTFSRIFTYAICGIAPESAVSSLSRR